MYALKNVKYEKNAREYQDLFDALLCRVTISQEHVISLYFFGEGGRLPTKLEMSVRMFKPATLVDAHSLTILQEAILDAMKKKHNPVGPPNTNTFDNGAYYGNASKLAIFSKPNTPVNAPFDNTTFTTDVMLLPLRGCEMVFGIQWLATLRDIKCKFKELRIEFKYGCKKVKLQGTHKSNVEWMNGKQIENSARQVVEG
nr:reverse transcriptase [Tanacetum cinerariifolium]